MRHEIVYKRVDELIPYARNARTHSEEQVAQIAASIREFGFNAPVLIDGQGGIIAGHGRVMAGRKLGLENVPTIALPHLSDVQKQAYILADNKLALNSGWDSEMLQLELEEIAADGLDISLAGFSDEEFEELLEGDGDDFDNDGGNGLDGEKYTTKLEIPIYEIKGECPEISEIFSLDKFNKLVSDINNSGLNESQKAFLTFAANRHIVFNYEKIAEFYAHQDENMKHLMEDSALVIIDYKKAIECAYVKMSDALIGLSKENEENE